MTVFVHIPFCIFVANFLKGILLKSRVQEISNPRVIQSSRTFDWQCESQESVLSPMLCPSQVLAGDPAELEGYSLWVRQTGVVGGPTPHITWGARFPLLLYWIITNEVFRSSQRWQLTADFKPPKPLFGRGIWPGLCSASCQDGH